MKNRGLLFRISLCAAALLCLSACVKNNEPVPQTETTVAQKRAERVAFEQIWAYDQKQKRDVEFAIISGLDAAGETVWTHVTDKYPIAQDDVVEEVLSSGNQYIFCEYGTLVSLDIPTGEILWENSEFDGYGVCGMEADSGELYFCGYLGTSFFAVDKNGKTLHQIGSFGAEYDWAHDIRMDGDKIVITLGLGPEEFRTPDGFIVLVDPTDYSFVPQKNSDNP